MLGRIGLPVSKQQLGGAAVQTSRRINQLQQRMSDLRLTPTLVSMYARKAQDGVKLVFVIHLTNHLVVIVLNHGERSIRNITQPDTCFS